ncbi:ABC transporter substrate-binding protein [Alkalibaculum sp. M08DMB]|uniref:ABC transporter substrate-binding protein n=1 Tax=Alkalibaculum sporogenes TaxID=2655001 RepID=A0A6A7K5M5_9FIRM|nr:ABC transporter substrate-binding protein [Alkalibaculum sporogenes]MPW24685.1 ABC transporter substrate-binding protein [Alkalibaculum sporogenes]
MKKFSILIFILLIVSIVLFGFIGCEKEDVTVVKLNEVTHSVFYAPQYAAISQGFFSDEGLKIEITNGQGADKVLTAVISGDSDIGFCGPEASVYVYNQGKEDYAISFAQLTKRDGSFILGRDPDPDFTFDKLIDKDVIGGRKGGMPMMNLQWVLKQNGIDPDQDVNIDSSIQFAAMAGAFKGGTGDYVSLFEPTALALEKEGAGYVVASLGVESGEVPYTCYNATKSYIEENPDIIQKFTNAIYRGQLWVKENSPEEIAQAIVEFFPDTDIDDLTAVVKRYKDQDSWNTTPMLTQDSFEHMQNIMESAGELNKRAPFDDLVNTKFAETAIENIK